MKILKTCFEFLWKGLVIGFLNLVTLTIVGGVLTSLGVKFPEVKGDFSFILYIMFLSGFIISIIGGIIVKQLHLPKSKVFVALFLMFFLNVVTQMLEALFFAPGLVSWETAPAIFGQQSIMYLFISAGITLLFRYNGETEQAGKRQKRSWRGWLGRILVSSGSYVLFYFIFGSINAALITGDYYRSEISGLHLPSTLEILMLEPIRAALLVLSVIPLIMYLRVSKKKCAAIVGMVLFILGGLLPMLQQLNTLPTAVAVSSIFEMFFQFFLTGVVITYIFLYEKPTIQESPSVSDAEKGNGSGLN
ncbi:MAG TPA: YqhR family membrane protein [Clostridia bacterium]|nr:YqhR family membrane protein [Clostridia bacterium]